MRGSMHIPICPCRLKHRTSWTSAHVASPGLHHWLKMSPHTETSSVTRDVFKCHKRTQTTSMKLAKLQLWWSLTLCSFELTSKKIGRKNISIKNSPQKWAFIHPASQEFWSNLDAQTVLWPWDLQVSGVVFKCNRLSLWQCSHHLCEAPEPCSWLQESRNRQAGKRH